MGKYTADIEIAVRGGQQIDGAIKSLNRLNNSVNVVNRNAKLLEGKGFNVASMENYSRAVGKAERALRKAAEGTDLERQAVNRLVTAMDAENKARSRRNFLIAQEVANRRRVVATADAGFGVQGPQAANIRAPRGPASPIGGTRTGGGGGAGGRAGGAISSALIGGGFPLLFGQGAGAAAGGAVGGLAGGLLGGGFGFALSIVGTAIGDAVTKAEELDKSLTKVNASAKGVGNTAADVSKLASSLGIAKDEAIKLLAQFSAFESASSRSLLAATFGEGDFKAAFDALEKATKEQGILDAIVASRGILGNLKTSELVTQLRINGGTRAELVLQEALIRAREKLVIEDKKRITLQDRLLAVAASGAEFVDPAVFGKERAAAQQKEYNRTREARKKQIAKDINEAQKLFADIDKLSQQYADKDKVRKKDKTQNNTALFNEQARQAEQLARNQIALDNAIFRNKMALADAEFAARQRIAELQGRLAEAGAFGAQREVIALINATSNSQSEYFAQARQLSGAIAQATQELKSANAMVGAQQAGVVQAGAGGMSQGRYIQGGIGPRGANQYGPHFDIKRSDGGYYSRTALDKYVQVNGRPLSSGVTVPGGEFGAPRSYGPHAGRDYAFGGKAAMTLTGGAKFISSKAGSYGDAAAFMTPDGKVYKVIHGKFEGTTQAPTGQVPQSFAKGQSQVVGASGDVAVANANLQAEIDKRKQLLGLYQQVRDLQIQISVAQGTEFLRNAQEQTMQIEREIEKRKIRNRLALEGVAPEIIEGEMRVYDIVKQKEEKLNELTTALSRLTKTQQYATEATLQSALADLGKKETTGSLTLAEQTLRGELQQRLTLLQQINALETGTPAVVEGARGAAAAQVQTTPELLEAEAGKAKLALQTLVEPANMITNAAAGIGDAFGASFKGIVDGSMTAQQGLATFFKSVADMFLDMAAQIIAAWIKMAILNTIVKIFGAGFNSGFGGNNSFSSFDAGGAQAFSAPALSTGAAFGAGGATNYSGALGNVAFNPAAFAEGGFVTGPTSAVIGEGGESEYVIPASKMQSAMSRYSRGARGEGVIAGSGGGTEGGGGAAAAGPMVVDVRYSVERINDVEYVTASAFQAGMRQAAQQGAAQGEQRTLRRLQQSPGTRKRVGM